MLNEMSQYVTTSIITRWTLYYSHVSLLEAANEANGLGRPMDLPIPPAPQPFHQQTKHQEVVTRRGVSRRRGNCGHQELNTGNATRLDQDTIREADQGRRRRTSRTQQQEEKSDQESESETRRRSSTDNWNRRETFVEHYIKLTEANRPYVNAMRPARASGRVRGGNTQDLREIFLSQRVSRHPVEFAVNRPQPTTRAADEEKALFAYKQEDDRKQILLDNHPLADTLLPDLGLVRRYLSSLESMTAQKCPTGEP
ncbi:hypothetical protein SARC_02433 [Sphaeroforma arctica JP610]|uniref:Uncharacterized protein n=1 Tax=Sphaeroforma arctica JP610 TaxID=667725 RepID=A0A0L0G8P0_9EUKA|nr:hypothetical protein SARC_02433 [Sphaeroforma arctica JP610]KNC85375.1 hypothetical protein SARC_02433 [Sphaeroforma arctica JP610]|eukprot:XP_014159277.1 hypothetical protein SARC_02433 [Sphaeroforma arctica JP610]